MRITGYSLVEHVYVVDLHHQLSASQGRIGDTYFSKMLGWFRKGIYL